MFVGRLVEKKGVAVLLEALRGLGDGWSLQIIGDGPLRADLEEMARRGSRPGQVEFLGTMGRESVARAYAAASVAVFPSVPAASGDQDGLPVALMEAMALGCPIVASRLPGIDAAIEHGESGLLVPPGDVAELAAAVRRLLVDDQLRAQLGEGARQRADDFSVEAAGARYRAVLHGVLTRAVSPSASAR
jgi:glycosyltransferase involved in cell wall biosynthesis